MTVSEIQHAQTVLTLDTIEKLKEVTREGSTKEALNKAVDFTIKNMNKKTGEMKA
ncbi:MAG: DUF5371 family protein [Ignavibacteria bacterium]|nr:DUF5371 family protein [Ignavibacteria bacterium]